MAIQGTALLEPTVVEVGGGLVLLEEERLLKYRKCSTL